MAEAQAAETRSLVPHLTLGESRDQDYLNGSRCTKCGTTYVGPRHFCGVCSAVDAFEPVQFGRDGEVHVWSIIHQSRPGIPTPYVAAIVDLADGVSVMGNVEGIEAKPENVSFGMKVRMFTEKVSEDREGNSYVAYKFKPIDV